MANQFLKGRAPWRSPRILAAIDPSHANDKPSELDGEIVNAARAVATAVGGSVYAAHVYGPLATYVPGVPIGATVRNAIPAQARAYKAAVRRPA